MTAAPFAHTFVVRTPHHTILVDTCVGNDRDRSVIPEWHRMRSDYPARLAAVGVIPKPHRSSSACRDPELAARTRREFVERYADADTLVLGSHFAPPSAVRIASGPHTCRPTF